MQNDSDNGRPVRTCKACEGTGVEKCESRFRLIRGRHRGLCYGRACRDCLACSGSGVISERIPASDALADAETLRLFWRMHGNILFERGRAVWTCFTPELTYVARYLREIKQPRDVWAGDNARAAFRAVPGLRG